MAAAQIDGLIDWDLALRTVSLVARPGPRLPAGQAEAAVEGLRRAAATATPHVEATTGLVASPGAPVLVVDRQGWAAANVAGFRAMLGPVVEDVVAARGTPLGGPLRAVGARVTGAELGSLLGFLSSRVLGQYDPFSALGDVAASAAGSAAGPRHGRLMLVAPNIVSAETELGVEPADFRLWVALHEETHRVQFTANPWLAEHLLGEVRGLVGGLLGDPAQTAQRLLDVLRSLPEVVRGGGTGLIEAVQTPAQREALAAITAVMSLLEGHADVVMDEVGPAVVPSVAEIRRRFTRRRAGQGALDQLLRRLLGLDAKLRQYADGARFVRGVTKDVGMAGFNAVWSGPDTLPRPAEIADPGAWVRRVHG